MQLFSHQSIMLCRFAGGRKLLLFTNTRFQVYGMPGLSGLLRGANGSRSFGNEDLKHALLVLDLSVLHIVVCLPWIKPLGF